MKVDKKANFLIFLIIAILALGLSNFAAAFTGNLVMGSFPGINGTDKMIALDDDNFSPASVNPVYEPKVVEEVNETDNSTDNSTDYIDDDTNNKPNGNSDDQNSNSDSDNDRNSSDDSDSKPKPAPSDDSSDDE